MVPSSCVLSLVSVRLRRTVTMQNPPTAERYVYSRLTNSNTTERYVYSRLTNWNTTERYVYCRLTNSNTTERYVYSRLTNSNTTERYVYSRLTNSNTTSPLLSIKSRVIQKNPVSYKPQPSHAVLTTNVTLASVIHVTLRITILLHGH